MKVIVFQGQSQYDVLRTYSSFYTQKLQEYGIEAITCDMNIVDSNMYLEIVEKFNPDFTMAYNPVVYYYENTTTHFQKTKIPHIVRMGDSPYYHVFDRALKNPNDEYLLTVTPQTTFEYGLKELGVKRFSILTHSPANQHFKVNFKDKIFPTVFFGSYVDPDKILLRCNEIRGSEQVLKLVIEFCLIIRDHINSTKMLLSDPIEKHFADFLKSKVQLDQAQINLLTRQVFYFIDHYYRNLIRKIVLTEFAKANLEMYVFGGNDVQQLMGNYGNVKVLQPINYHEYLNVVAHSKISLNITPMFKNAHERISTALFNSTLLCSNVMEDLIRSYPDILNSTVFYNLNNLKETTDVLKQLSSNEKEYNQIIESGSDLAESHFTFDKDIDQVINSYNKFFN